MEGKEDFLEKLQLKKLELIHYNTNLQVNKIDNVKYLNNDMFYLVVDRVITKNDEPFYNRLADAVEISIFEGNGICLIEDLENNKIYDFNTRFELDGMSFTEPNVHLFSFNNPYGACPKCEGYGDIVGIDKNLVIKNKELSVYEDAILPWKGQKLSKYKNDFINQSHISLTFLFTSHILN